MAITLTLTDEQVEIIGYAIFLAIRDQQGKMADVLATRSDADPKKAHQVWGFRERIQRLEDAYRTLPAEECT
jgi:hypothetical protein